MDTVDEFVGRTLTTLYASNFNLDEMSPLFELFQGFPWVTLTEDQRQHIPGKPKLLGQVYPGIAKDAYKLNPTPESVRASFLSCHHIRCWFDDEAQIKSWHWLD